MKIGKRRIVLIAMVVSALLAGACERGAVGGDEGEERTEGPAKVALITDSAGATSLFGVSNINAARMAIEEINEDGGVLGEEVELLVRDSKSDPELGVSLTREAILEEEVDAIFGPVSSAVAVAMTDVARQNKTPIFFHTSNTQTLTAENFHPYAFMVGPNTTMEGRGNAIDLADEPYKRWAVIAPDYEFGHLQSDAFITKLQELNPDVQIVKKVYPALGEREFTSFINSILAEKPDAVYSALFAGDLIGFTQQAEPLGFFDEVFFTSLYETDALQALGEAAPEGVRGYSRAPFFAIDSETIDEFVQNYRDRYGIYPSDWAIMAYDAVKLWAEGVEEAGSLDPDELVEVLEGYEFESLRGPVTIREIDHQASVPVYSGTVTQDPDVGFATWTDVREIPGEEVWLSEEEVQQQQGQ